MDIFLFLLSDHIWLPVIEIVIFYAFLWSIYHDICAYLRKDGSVVAVVKRGEKSWSTLLTSLALSFIIIEIILSSDLVIGYKVLLGLLNAFVLAYLTLKSSSFKNKIIGWSIKLKNMGEHV